MPPEGMDLPEEYKADMADTRRRLAAVAAEGGLAEVYPEHIPNSRRALEATEYAEQQGSGEEFHRAVFRKRYVEGLDISSWDVLRAAATEAGLDPDELQRETGGGRYRAIVEQKAEAAREMGIHAVPTYVINDEYRIVGVQPFETFRQAIEQITTGAD